jgi:hypothetical protein
MVACLETRHAARYPTKEQGQDKAEPHTKQREHPYPHGGTPRVNRLCWSPVAAKLADVLEGQV